MAAQIAAPFYRTILEATKLYAGYRYPGLLREAKPVGEVRPHPSSVSPDGPGLKTNVSKGRIAAQRLGIELLQGLLYGMILTAATHFFFPIL